MRYVIIAAVGVVVSLIVSTLIGYFDILFNLHWDCGHLYCVVVWWLMVAVPLSMYITSVLLRRAERHDIDPE